MTDDGPPAEPLGTCLGAPTLDLRFGTPAPEQGYGLSVWSGGLVVVGHRNNGATVSDAAILRLDPSTGAVISQTEVGTPEYDVFEGVVAAEDGSFVAVGYRGSPGLGTADAWVYRADAADAKQWELTFGGGGDDYLRAVDRLDAATVVAVGTDADPLTGDSAVLVVALTEATGAVVWTQKLGGPKPELAFDITPMGDGGGLALAAISKTGEAGDMQGWALTLSNDGLPTQSVTAGGLSDDYARSVAVLPDGTLVVGGMRSITDTDNDGWLFAVSGNEVVWEHTLGGDLHEDVRSVVTLPDGSLFVGANQEAGSGGAGSDAWLHTVDAEGATLSAITVGGPAHDVAHAAALATTGDSIAVVGYSTSDSQGSFDIWYLSVPLIPCAP